MQDHLRPVPSSGGNAFKPEHAKVRAPQRQRPSKPLPSDRMKFDTAVLALRAIVLESANGTKDVGAQEMAKRLSLTAATAGLNNAFFTEAGFITRTGKGRWLPAATAIEFARTHGFDCARGGRSLTESLRGSWYFREVEQQLRIGPTTVPQMIEVLAHGAGATAGHGPQLRLVLAWLEYAGLIDMSTGTVRPTTSTARQAPPDELQAPADTESERTTTNHQPLEAGDSRGARAAPQDRQGVPVLTLSFEFSLSAADLAKLSPDQIRAIYEAVGRVAAIKAGIYN